MSQYTLSCVWNHPQETLAKNQDHWHAELTSSNPLIQKNMLERFLRNFTFCKKKRQYLNEPYTVPINIDQLSHQSVQLPRALSAEFSV